MHKFLRTMTAAAVAAAMAPAFAADATYNVDVVVVGAGAAGTAAGWAAAEKGLKVVTLEKQAMVGGTGKFSEGIFAVESSMQRNWNYGLTKDEAFQKIMNYGHWRGNAKMVRAFVDKSGETIDWMQANGVKFEKLFSNYPNGLYTWHIYEGRGAGWINLFQQKYKNAGQTLLLNTWGKELIQDKNGTVKGVVATNKNGDKITVNAKATIIATGGFFDNKEMREKYLRFPDADGLAQKGKTGDGIQMAWSAGGGKEGCEVQASYRPGPRGIGTTNHVSATAKQPHLWLTPRGERFCDEKIMLEWPFAGNALERIGGTMYVVYDQATLDHMEKDKGIDLGVGVMVPVGTKLTNFEKEWADAVKGGWAFKADPRLARIKITRNVMFGHAGTNVYPPTKGIWGDGIVVQDTCRQCAHPTPCANACPQGAIVVDPKTGARRVDKEKCIGCHLCEKACPWGMMTFDVEEKKASKCFLCDGEPKCVKHCPAAAIRYVPWMDRTGDEPRQSIHGYLPQENRDQCSICHR